MNDFIYKLLVSNAGWESVTLRVPIGIILAAHGSQKLFGWFGGHGLEGTGQWMASVDLLPRPAAINKCNYNVGRAVVCTFGEQFFSG
jgi:uncharacterized membrane protein YphA (DoxX/SURF4 family)